jgi:hypothetical protein
MSQTLNKGRIKTTRVGDEPFYVADFKGLTVIAHQQAASFVIQYDPCTSLPSHELNPGFLAFKGALQCLEQSEHYQPTRKDTSLIGDLSRGWEPAHIFVALNLYPLEQYAAGEWAHFHDPSYCCWLAMQAAYRYGKPTG